MIYIKYNYKSIEKIKRISYGKFQVSSMNISFNTSYLIIAINNTIKIWNIDKEKLIETIYGHSKAINHLQF